MEKLPAFAEDSPDGRQSGPLAAHYFIPDGTTQSPHSTKTPILQQPARNDAYGDSWPKRRRNPHPKFHALPA